MIIKYEHRGSYDVNNYEIVESYVATPNIIHEALAGFTTIFESKASIHDSLLHDELQDNLMKHIRDLHQGNQILFL